MAKNIQLSIVAFGKVPQKFSITTDIGDVLDFELLLNNIGIKKDVCLNCAKRNQINVDIYKNVLCFQSESDAQRFILVLSAMTSHITTAA